jgi:hypothetical protein
MDRKRQEFEKKNANHFSGPQISSCHAFCSVVEARGLDRIQLGPPWKSPQMWLSIRNLDDIRIINVYTFFHIAELAIFPIKLP